ncbi:MAG: hypothetical protein PHT07_21070 [Paludibacter sp.]|nr:hypothetical protein [Paludibacter sp.]
MNKPNNTYLLGFYIGQQCIEHPEFGAYILDGFFSKGYMATRNLTGKPEDQEYEMFGFDEVKLVLKPCSDSLLKRFSNSLLFIKKMSGEGRWLGDQGEFGKSIIKVRL